MAKNLELPIYLMETLFFRSEEQQLNEPTSKVQDRSKGNVAVPGPIINEKRIQGYLTIYLNN